ncbi:MAG: alcohol dehydrogenase catalytic domain-containing protein, partial [Yaniella sp.]|nr:alcohol dehydrogenase catalytic domain-containing protein [Yaniella sp.]
MKSVRYYGTEDVRIEDIPEPELVDGSVKIAPAFNGLCGSDLSLFFSGPLPPAPTDSEPHALSGEVLPVVFGHEFSGVVTEVAHDVDHVQVGDRVVVEPLMVDGTCWACQQGQYNLCEQMGFIGISGRGGGMAQSIVVEKRWVHPIGDMALEEGALIEPLAVALKAKGLNVILSEVSAARQQIAKDAGYADRIVDPTEESLLNVVHDATDGVGAAFAFDCAGVEVVF